MQAEWTERNTICVQWQRGALEINLIPANGRLPTTTYARRGLQRSLIYLHDNVGIVALRLHGCPAVPRICWDNREHHFWKRFNGGFRPRNTVINDIRVRTNAAARALRVSCYYITDHVLTRVAWLFREPPGDGTLAWDTLFEFENLRDRPLENYMAFFACYHAPGRNTYWDKQDRLVDCADSFLGYADATRKQRVEAVTAGFQRQVRHWTAGIDRPSRAAEFYGAPILLSEPRAWFGHGRHLLMVEPGKCAHIASIMRQARDYMLTPEDRIWEPGATFTARVRHVIAPLAGMPEVRHQWEVFKHESDETPRMDITG